MRFRVMKKLLCLLSLAGVLLMFVILMKTSDVTPPVKSGTSPRSDFDRILFDVTKSDNRSPAHVTAEQQPPQQHQRQQHYPLWQQQLQRRKQLAQQRSQQEQQQHHHEQQQRLPPDERYPALGGSVPGHDGGPADPPAGGEWSRGAAEEAGAHGLWESILPRVVNGHGYSDSRKCPPKHHILFLKVHKTGSSTVANILQRYGFTRKLNFVLPRRRLHSASYNYLNNAGQKLTKDMLVPPPKGEHYDILWNHATYNGPFFHEIMPPDTVFISILREPLQQFQSAFEYYGISAKSYLYPILHKNVSNPLSDFLRTPHKNQSLLSYVRNKQAQDFGMKFQHVVNEGLRRQYIEQLEKDFDLVMITEYFDESLVLLKRLMCWDLKDILYIPKNKNSRKKKRAFTDEDRANHRKYSVADYDLYDFFRKKFEDTLKTQGIDFHSEVGYFKDLLRKVQFACSRYGSMSVDSSPWNDKFEVSKTDCLLMMKNELGFYDDLMVDAVRRYQFSLQ